MLILAKSILGLMLGFVLALIAGFILIPLLKKLHIGQSVSHLINARHLKKEGTPTMGGIIFIFSTLFIMLILFLNNNISFSLNFLIIILIFILYAFLGFLDDYIKVRKQNKPIKLF